MGEDYFGECYGCGRDLPCYLRDLFGVHRQKETIRFLGMVTASSYCFCGRIANDLVDELIEYL